MIRRPPRSTLSSSSAASDVYKRQLLSTAGRQTHLLLYLPLLVITSRKLRCLDISLHLQQPVADWQELLLLTLRYGQVTLVTDLSNKSTAKAHHSRELLLSEPHNTPRRDQISKVVTQISPAIPINPFQLSIDKSTSHPVNLPMLSRLNLTTLLGLKLQQESVNFLPMATMQLRIV